MGTSTWPVLWQVSFTSINYSFLRENPSWISSRNPINRLLSVWDKCARTTHRTLKEDHSGEPASGEGRSSRVETEGSGPATAMPARVKPRLPPAESRLEERALSLGQNLTRGLDRSGGGPMEEVLGSSGLGAGQWGDLAEVGWGSLCTELGQPGASGAPGKTQLCSCQGGQQGERAPGRRPAGDVPGAPLGPAGAKLSPAPGGKEHARQWPPAGPPRCTRSCSLAPCRLHGLGFAAHRRLRSAPLVAMSPDQRREKQTAFLTRSAAHLTTAQRHPRGHVCTPSSSGSQASTRGRQGADGEAGADPRAAPADAVQPPRASAGKDRTPPVLGLQMPQAVEPCQAHLTSVLAGDPAHSFPELRQHLQVRHDRGLQLQRERWGCCDWCPICEGQSLAHAPQGGAANGHVSPSNTGPTGVGAPAWRHGQDSKRVPPQWPGLRHPGGSAVLGAGQQGVLAREGFTHTEAGPSSSDGETQGALLFYGPEDLGKEASVQNVRLRRRAGTASARGGQRCLRRCPWWGGS